MNGIYLISHNYFGTVFAIVSRMMLLIIAMISLISPAPPVRDLHEAALKYAQIDSTEISKWKSRVKWSAALPKLQVDFSHRIKNVVDLNIDDNVYVGSSGIVIGPEEGGYSEGADLYRSFGVKAVWSLDELIFKRDSLSVSEQKLKVMRERNILLDLVNKHYFEREKLISEIEELSTLKNMVGDRKVRMELKIRKIGVERENAALDALTGGWFSLWMEEKGLLTE